MREKINPDEFEFEERPICINRVMRVRKGGRTPSFNATSVVGNRAGIVGLGFGSANDIPSAIGKSIADAKKNLIRIPLSENTIPHEILGKYGAAKILIKPASAGTGILAGLATRVILEFGGVQDALTKRLGSRNIKNTAEATIQALRELKDINEVARLRGRTVEDILA
ncbi:MAG: 30S ribosomal protein S5 [Candidatus Poribacteria bacterium]|nr:30S ribosomal protein S5 [Candidatus Poribacteria bacterium]